MAILFSPSFARANSPNDTLPQKISPGRTAIIAGAASSTLGATYIFLQNAWWKETSQGFHFDNGRDLKYARNLDKAAHFLGGVIYSDIFFQSLRWAHFPEKKAYLYGALFGIFVQAAIEIKDGYAPRWGFSPWDVTLGSAGSFLPMAQRYWKPLSVLDIKFSYYKRYNTYFDFNPNGHTIDDYINQTYWASLKVHKLLPEKAGRYWPRWLAIAGGLSIDETTDGMGGGNIEFFLALDYDLSAIIPKKRPFWNKTFHFLNYIKLPAPAIRFSPNVRKYWMYL